MIGATTNSAGQITYESSEARDFLIPRPRTNAPYECWTPAPDVARHLPVGFAIPFLWTGNAEDRRFRPLEPVSDFLQSAALAGDAILRCREGLSGEQGATYDMMRLIARLAPQIRERFHVRKFSSERELFGRESSTNSASGILPAVFGPSGQARWTVADMLGEGRRAAVEDGVLYPRLNEVIMYGIDAEAILNPMDVTEISSDELWRTLRFAQFDVAPGDSAITEDLKHRVYDRLTKAIRSKNGKPTAEFNCWFLNNFDNVIHRIAKKKRPGGAIDTRMVRGALLELVFDSWRYLGQTVDIFMRSLADIVQPSLSVADRDAYNALYCASPHLCDLPLILLHEQFRVVRPVLVRILNDPTTPELWGQLHRVLRTYAEMITRRRAADRSKKKSPGREVAIRAEPEARENNDSQMDEIVAELLELRDLTCNCNAGRWEGRIENDAEPGQNIELIGICRECGTQHTLNVPREEFTRIARRALGLDN